MSKSPKENQLKLLEVERLFDINVQSFNDRILHDDNGRTLVDFCNTGYLGFEYREEVIEKGVEFARKWGTISGWSRMELDPIIYKNLEQRLNGFLGCSDILLSHTVTITNFSIMPFLSKNGVIFTDKIVHTVVYESARLARDHGTEIISFNHQDMDSLESVLKNYKGDGPKIIAVDGVYSISSEYAPMKDLVDLAEKYDAYVYVDDAHGFGVLGENPNDENPYGSLGKGVCSYFGVNYDRVIYVASFGKAFGTSVAFSTIPEAFQDQFRANCMQFLFSAPPSPFQIGNIEACLDLNEKEGDEIRKRIFGLTKRLCSGLEDLGMSYLNSHYFPVIFVKIGEFNELVNCAKLLVEREGIIPGYRGYPVVPHHECGMRFAITGLHDEDSIDKLLSSFNFYLKQNR